jgi:hypothetical protein
VGNPVLVWILLHVVVPIVVRLVVEWWLARWENDRAAVSPTQGDVPDG